MSSLNIHQALKFCNEFCVCFTCVLLAPCFSVRCLIHLIPDLSPEPEEREKKLHLKELYVTPKNESFIYVTRAAFMVHTERDICA